MESVSPITMPKLGLTMTEGMISSWLVKPGDLVSAGDIIVVVETDKIATDVEAAGDGRIVSIEAGEGATVEVGSVIATWTGAAINGDGDHAQPINKAAESPPGATAQPVVNGRSAVAKGERIIATPLARRIAKDGRIDLRATPGSGPNGRIKAADVQWAIAALSQARQPDNNTSIPVPPPIAGDRRPATSIERVIARRLTESKQIIPHFYVLSEADIGAIERIRGDLNDGATIRISINHFIITAVARALAATPQANALWQNEEIITPATIDIGIAVDTDRGLFVPVLRDAGKMTVNEGAHRSATLIEGARQGKLQTGDLDGGVISVSNVGMFGATALVPIINPGQSAILGVGAVRQVFRPDAKDAPKLCREISLILSCDHRVLDGVLAAQLLEKIRFYIEHPLLLLRT